MKSKNRRKLYSQGLSWEKKKGKYGSPPCSRIFRTFSQKRPYFSRCTIKKNTYHFKQRIHRKINNEMESSFPKKAEIERFFVTGVIRDEVRQFIRYNPQYWSGNLTTLSFTKEEERELLILCIQDDLEFGEMKLRLKQMREWQGAMSPEEREIFQNEVNNLEISIRNFERNWSEKQSKRRKEFIQARKQKNQEIEAIEGIGEISLVSNTTNAGRWNTNTGSENISLNENSIPAQDWITTSGPAIVSWSAR